MFNMVNICFGRYQPVTRGHAAHFEEMVRYSKLTQSDVIVFTSSTENESNPLPVNDKVSFLERVLVSQGCPVHTSRDIFTAVESLVGKYDVVTYHAGGDYFESSADQALFTRLSLYADKVGIICRQMSTGSRVNGVSGTDMRTAAANEDLEAFVSLSPIGCGDFTIQDAINMYHSVVTGLKTYNK